MLDEDLEAYSRVFKGNCIIKSIYSYVYISSKISMKWKGNNILLFRDNSFLVLIFIELFFVVHSSQAKAKAKAKAKE